MPQPLSREQVFALLEERVRSAGGPGPFARLHSLSRVYVRDALLGRRELGPSLLTAIGLERTVSVFVTHANSNVGEAADVGE